MHTRLQLDVDRNPIPQDVHEDPFIGEQVLQGGLQGEQRLLLGS